MRRAAAWAALFASAAALPAAASNTRPIVSLTVPPATANGPWGALALIVLDRDRAYPSGGYFCPASDDPNVICHGASIVEGSGQIIRYLSVPTEGWVRTGARQRFRFVGGHAVRWVDSPRSVAIIEQTEAGHRWVAWAAPIQRGWICFPQSVVDHFDIVSARPFQPRGEEPNCLSVR
jgi:hypothetical protein